MTSLSQCVPMFSKRAYVCKPQTFILSRWSSTHIYQEVIPWKHNKALADDMAKTIFYNKDGLIALCKPYGVGSSAKAGQKQYKNAAPVGDKIFNFYDTLPYLAKQIECEELFVASIPERYTSGITLLTTSSYLCQKAKASLQLSKVADETMNLYAAVVLGSPKNPNGSFKVGIQMSKLFPDQPRIVQWARTTIKKQNMHSVRVTYDTLGSSDLASLLSIRCCYPNMMTLRVLCTDKLVVPILGDNMFGSRVQSVMGRHVKVSFALDSARKPKKLTPEIYKALNVQPGQELIIPTHLHLQEVHLAKFQGKNITLRTPLPPLFQWSCEKLGIEVPDCAPCEEVSRKEFNRQNREKMKSELTSRSYSCN